jgi:hypothetical protein
MAEAAIASASPVSPVVTSIAFPNDELQTARLSRPWLYRWWFARRNNPALERRLLRVFGPFAKHRITLAHSGPTEILPATESNLGPGWHHLFPGDAWRWAGNPDSRLTFVGVVPGRIRLTIALKADDWRVHTPGALGVYANGMLVGQVDRDQSIIVADVTDAVIRGFLDISLRLISGDPTPNKGIASPRNQLLAPVLSIRLESSPA